MGDASVLPIPSTVNVVNPGENCYAVSEKCCWKTSATACDSKYSDYSGCNRTSCNWAAGNEICSKFKYGNLNWRLPTEAELGLFVKNSLNLGNNGLQLCDNYADNGFNRCAYSVCHYSYPNNGCYPRIVWGELEENGKIPTLNINSGSVNLGGSFSYSNSSKSQGRSVRCVADLQ